MITKPMLKTAAVTLVMLAVINRVTPLAPVKRLVNGQ